MFQSTSVRFPREFQHFQFSSPPVSSSHSGDRLCLVHPPRPRSAAALAARASHGLGCIARRTSRYTAYSSPAAFDRSCGPAGPSHESDLVATSWSFARTFYRERNRKTLQTAMDVCMNPLPPVERAGAIERATTAGMNKPESLGIRLLIAR